jgi:hypothetical protein
VDGTTVGISTAQNAQVLDVADGSLVADLPLLDVWHVTVSPNRRLLAAERRVNSGADTTVSIHDLPSGRHLATEVHEAGITKFWDQGIGTLRFIDNRYLLSGGHLMKIWRIENAPV